MSSTNLESAEPGREVDPCALERDDAPGSANPLAHTVDAEGSARGGGTGAGADLLSMDVGAGAVGASSNTEGNGSAGSGVRVGALVDTSGDGVTSEFCGTAGPSLCGLGVERDSEEDSCAGDSARVMGKVGPPGMMVLLSAGKSGRTGCRDAAPLVCTTVLRLPESTPETEVVNESTCGGSSEPACASVLN
jgi:hypothetical protein